MRRQLRRGRTVVTGHNLLTSAWTTEVKTLETAIELFPADRLPQNDCQVAFFEMAHDDQLHVNVTHQRETVAVRGWAGPGRTPAGYVHNRRFADTPTSQIIRHIRDVVFAGAAK